MKIICLVKFIPDVENIQFDQKKNILMREKAKLKLNPDDEIALAAALKVKEAAPETNVEIVTMGPEGVSRKFQDLLRRDVDRGTLISDPLYVGSDTYATSRIIGEFLKTRRADCIFTGTHSLDGDTSHVPGQIAEILDIPQMNNVITVNIEQLLQGKGLLEVNSEGDILQFQMKLPGIISFEKSREYKMPYIRYEDFQRDVRDKMEVLTNQDLQLTEEEVGLSGSLTEVSRTFMKTMGKKENITVKNDEEGIERVYQFLKEKEYI
ncbi:electron transfer flavoprotein subunit beta/FixA family protein [Isachenkonia alkalipeptolytica]|uniref:Electron transfer flavoprotein small subunit n=1 Tax=Isachenkonia alkalipeptolytica TaxID=2565777 RepID=A0AA43XKB3_9CLOT|nr:electron transfer flavoprotein subunit beta/FixA family protein [Isachenkonia alkalipeptolytica]NBG88403.1 electron transfer flavoprotein subunit beta/FixA family protein [Isachenkonia alkalipeptolytica]